MRMASRLCFIAMLGLPMSAMAQDRDSGAQIDVQPVIIDTEVARTATINGNRIGERQSRDTAAQEAGVKPMARLNNRITGRIPSRLQTRLDRNFVGQATPPSR